MEAADSVMTNRRHTGKQARRQAVMTSLAEAVGHEYESQAVSHRFPLHCILPHRFASLQIGWILSYNLTTRGTVFDMTCHIKLSL